MTKWFSIPKYNYYFVESYQASCIALLKCKTSVKNRLNNVTIILYYYQTLINSSSY